MSEPGPPAAVNSQIDSICDHFESQWRLGKRPRIEDFLVGAPASARSNLLRELLPLEIALRSRAGEFPTSEEYIARFPEAGELVSQVFASEGNVVPTLVHVSASRPPNAQDSNYTLTSGLSTDAGTRYRILRSHAKGGLGEVYVAEDAELHRNVALKRIQRQHADHPEARARFMLEAEITGKLEHPGIVPVYGLGIDADGRPYYAMRFIQGDSLQEAVDQIHRKGESGRLPPSFQSLAFRKLLQRFIDVCHSIEYAHSRGVLHRDLKPGNIMLGKYGESLVVDWGLAKVQGREDEAKLSGESALQPFANGSAPTQMGAALGTPAYMSPEQAAGRLDQLSPASDVYSLGATLYYVLVGKAPFDKDELTTTLRKVQSGDFVPPRRINPLLPRSLEAVCLKAMAVDAASRYISAQELADDVERWLADEPVNAYRQPFPLRAWRDLKRQPGASGLAMSGLALTVTGIATAMDKFFEAQRWERVLEHQSAAYHTRLDADTAQIVEGMHKHLFLGVEAARETVWLGLAMMCFGLAVCLVGTWRVSRLSRASRATRVRA